VSGRAPLVARMGGGARMPPTDPGRPTHDEGLPHGSVYDWYHRGLALLSSGDPAAAAQLLAHAARAEPGSRSVREALARALFDSRQYAQAAEHFGRIVSESPTEDYARFGLGLALTRLGDFDAAVEHLALAVAMRPDERSYVTALAGARATLKARGNQG
jgi:Flp pilus assembly protein TadD